MLVASSVIIAFYTSLCGQSFTFEGDVLPDQAGWGVVGPAPAASVSTDGDILTIQTSDPTEGGISYRHAVTSSQDNTYYQWRSRTVGGQGGGAYLDLLIQGANKWSQVTLSWSENDFGIHTIPDTLSNADRQYVSSSFSGNALHEFEIVADHDVFDISVDGVSYLTAAGFQDVGNVPSVLQFGFTHIYSDIPAGSEWDYIRVGTIPEPATMILFLVGAFLSRTRQRSGKFYR